MEADFAEFYGLNLREGAGGPLHAACLAAQLPASSRTVRAEDPSCSWGSGEYLAALAVDHLAFLRYELAAMAGAKGARKPAAVPRPLTAVPKAAGAVERRRLDDALFRKRAQTPKEVPDG